MISTTKEIQSRTKSIMTVNEKFNSLKQGDLKTYAKASVIVEEFFKIHDTKSLNKKAFMEILKNVTY